MAVVVVNVDLHAFWRDLGVARELGGQGVVVRCEEACAADVRGDVVEDGLRDSDAIVGRGAAAELVEDHEGAGRGFGEDLLGFGELDEEGALCGEDVVVGSQAGHDAVAGSECGGDTWDVAADLSHNDSHAGL